MNISRAVSRIVFSRCRYRQGRMLSRVAACAIVAAIFCAPQIALATTVHMEITYGTNQGTIDLQLYDDQAPKTVANFLRYAGRGDYSTNGIIYRSVPGFVLQTGGYTYIDLTAFGALYRYYFHVPKNLPVPNEFALSNEYGTIAMAKLPGDPNSATSDWFINLANNSSIIDPNTGQQIGLDYQNGGFTVFGHVIDTAQNPGMTVVNAIASLPTLNESGHDTSGNPVNYPILNQTPPLPLPSSPFCSTNCNLPLSAFDTLPVINYDPTTGLDPSNLVMVTNITNVTATKTFTAATTSAYAADVDVTLTSPDSHRTVDPTTSATWLAAFTPPPGKTVQFNDEISRIAMSLPAGSSSSRVVTLYHGAATSVNGYYAYGPTADNRTPHWYDFSYDATTGTGAEFVGNKILLHFVDGQRGDDDLTADGSITHTGAPVFITDIPTSSPTSVGCSIAATPRPMRNGGDWIVVSIFLVFIALVRRRNRLDRADATRH
jgi:cyclophilin family peptidyl-prolyl cis-trans isomerase